MTLPGPHASDPHKFIQVRGARQHNLKNIDVDIPRDVLTVVTGLSGSGKSSLAFDTLYAEGQRRYVESLSVYARQFLEQMPKPDADRIEGLCPTIAIDQRAAVGSPRSTVATTTEIYDFLRVLFARAGTPTCWHCGREITRQSTARIVDQVGALPAGTRYLVLAPVVCDRRGAHAELLADIARRGFVRARVDGQVHHLEDLAPLVPTRKHTIEVVVDRLTVDERHRARLADSLEAALALGEGRVIISTPEAAEGPADRLYSSRLACPVHPEVNLADLSPQLFSFNSPHGACAACSGLGTVLEFDPDLLVVDPALSLAGGALGAWRAGGERSGRGLGALLNEFCSAFRVSPDTPYRSMPEDLAHILLHGTGRKDVERHGVEFAGLIPRLRQRWEETDSEGVKRRLHALLSEAPCGECGGARLRPEALAVRIGGRSIAEVCRLTVAEAADFVGQLRLAGDAAAIAAPLLREISARLGFMCAVGVEYLSLNRGSATLSGGEAQRIRLATQIGSGLVGVCYVLDEPTIGLHQRDTVRLVDTLRRLTAAGNTMVVVEHDEEVIRAADHVLDLGPGAGAEGGRLVACGTLADVLRCPDSLTARYLTGQCGVPVPAQRRRLDPRAGVEVVGAAAHNLKNIDVRFPLHGLVCVSGVSGSGKSTLVNEILLRALRRSVSGSGPRPGAHRRLSGASLIDRIVEIDQAPIGRTPRSNPATYAGIFNPVRQLFARTREARLRGYAPARFSFNVAGGRCDDCQGQGTRRIEMHFLPDVFVECATCRGTRYNRETLEIRYRGHSIADVLNMRVAEAAQFFAHFPRIKPLLRALLDVGLGYVTLGQSSTTLSGGEAQRVKLAAELGRPSAGHTLYLLDEPTTGLHPADVHNLLMVLNRLVDLGHSVVVIEHNLDVIKMADWIIDLGPEGGDAGGEVVVAGSPEEVAACPRSYTGQFLRARLAQHPPIVQPPAG